MSNGAGGADFKEVTNSDKASQGNKIPNHQHQITKISQ